jgi:hypothetical protein
MLEILVNCDVVVKVRPPGVDETLRAGRALVSLGGRDPVGANDVVNPAARTNPASPIFGMPILKVDDAKSVLVLKRGKGRGFSGVENDLFVDPKTSMLFGVARRSLLDLGLQVKEA